MKILFWILTVLSIIFGLFTSFISYVTHGLGLSYTDFGDAVCIVGMIAVIVCIICTVLGIVKLRKGKTKKALAFVLAGIIYCAIIFGGIFIDDAVYSVRLDESFEERNEQMYGEDWDSAPDIEGIPEQYQTVLNKYYAVVRDRWSADELTDLGAVSMADYYGDESLENIGFVFMDLNGDNVDELVIGAVARDGQQGNEIFCIYTDPENPFYAINSVEGDVYYLHPGEVDGTYEAEIVGFDSSWVIEYAESENTFNFHLKEGAMNPDGRLTLEITPFSQYK